MEDSDSSSSSCGESPHVKQHKKQLPDEKKRKKHKHRHDTQNSKVEDQESDKKKSKYKHTKRERDGDDERDSERELHKTAAAGDDCHEEAEKKVNKKKHKKTADSVEEDDEHEKGEIKCVHQSKVKGVGGKIEENGIEDGGKDIGEPKKKKRVRDESADHGEKAKTVKGGKSNESETKGAKENAVKEGKSKVDETKGVKESAVKEGKLKVDETKETVKKEGKSKVTDSKQSSKKEDKSALSEPKASMKKEDKSAVSESKASMKKEGNSALSESKENVIKEGKSKVLESKENVKKEGKSKASESKETTSKEGKAPDASETKCLERKVDTKKARVSPVEKTSDNAVKADTVKTERGNTQSRPAASVAKECSAISEAEDSNDDENERADEGDLCSSSKPSSVSSKKAPKRDSGLIACKVASAILASCQMSSTEFHDFVCARSYDVFSNGMYRKFLTQSRLAKEAWAFNVQISISKVQKLSKMLTCMLGTVKVAEKLHQQKMLAAAGDKNSKEEGLLPVGLANALHACMNSSSPPVLKRVETVWQSMLKQQQQQQISSKSSSSSRTVRCCISNVVLEDDCLEVRASYRSSQSRGSTSGAAASSKPKRKKASEDDDEEDDENDQGDGNDDRAGGAGSDNESDDCNGGNKNTDQGKLTATCSAASPASGGILHAAIVVHPDFAHFFHLFWFCSKIEHVVRHMARSWMEDFRAKGGGGTQDGLEKGVDGGNNDNSNNEEETEEEGALNMQGMCEAFASENAEIIKDMHAAFLYGHSHIIDSVYAHECMQDRQFQQGQQVAAPATSAKPQLPKPRGVLASRSGKKKGMGAAPSRKGTGGAVGGAKSTNKKGARAVVGQDDGKRTKSKKKSGSCSENTASMEEYLESCLDEVAVGSSDEDRNEDGSEEGDNDSKGVDEACVNSGDEEEEEEEEDVDDEDV